MQYLPAAAALAALLFFVYVTFLPALRTVRHGFPTYYVAARLVWEGRWSPLVYDNAWFAAQVQARTPNAVGEVFAPNPPTAALIMLPLAWLDLVTARRVWLWLNLGLLLGALALLLRRLPAQPPWARAGLVLLAALFAPLRENFRLANVYVGLLFLFSLALWGLERARTGPPGLGLGLAAGAKLSGSPLWLLLAARGRWRELVLAGLLALVLAAASLGLTGLPTWQRFAASLVEHAGEPGWAAGLSFQTTPSFFQHLFRPDARWNPQPLWVLPAWVPRACTLAVTGAAVAWLLWRARTASLDLAFAAALTLGVVALPLAEEYHYALLLLPLAVGLGHAAGGAAPRPRGTAFWLAAVILLLAVPWPYKDPWLNTGWHALLGYPRLYGGWLLWGWLMACLAPVPVEQSRAALAAELAAP
jgi:hypothetical protein